MLNRLVNTAYLVPTLLNSTDPAMCPFTAACMRVSEPCIVAQAR